ncbi:transport and Golgi organization protein 1-like isoform X2 [Homarus americanus]|uniref:transport and Golgi organization protein 1-like isoform X2 n=1 Tax=Homarus americanus TaxID=6706 RepID=UPI001C45C5C0|nr:transport and Golgi organization protein 1-like isoform X2 [Homarus americanus]
MLEQSTAELCHGRIMERRPLAVLFILTVLGIVAANISDYRLCADPKCEEPVSKGVTLINYPSNEERILSFPVNAEVTVYSKEAGERKDLWGVKIKGKRGYVPKQYIREKKIFKIDLDYEVPTEPFIDGEIPVDNNGKNNEDSNKDNDGAERKLMKNEIRSSQEKIAISAEDVEYNRLKVDDHLEEKEKASDEPTPGTEEVLKKQADVNDGADTEGVELARDTEGVELARDTEGVELARDTEGVELARDTEGVELARDTEGVELARDTQDDEDYFAEEEVLTNEENKVDEEGYVDKQEVEDVSDVSVNIGREEEDISVVPQELGSSGDTVSDDKSIQVPPSPATPSPVEDHSIKSTEAIDESDDESLHDGELSSANYEVIDGTTVYFDEDAVTATPVAPDVVFPSIALEASLVKDENLVSVHPHPSLSQALHVITQSDNIDIIPSAAPSFEDARSAVPDIVGSSQVLENSEQSTTKVPQAEHEKQVNEGKPDVIPSSSWLSSAASTVSSWMSGEETKVNEGGSNGENENMDTITQEILEIVSESNIPSPSAVDTASEKIVPADAIKNEEYGEPKPESVIDNSDVPFEEVAESGGFFSNWFGSSENNDNAKADESMKVSDSLKSDAASFETNDVEPDNNNASEDSRSGDSEAVPTDTLSKIASTDHVDVPVDETEIPENSAQTPHSADIVDIDAFNTQQYIPPSVDANPDSSASPSPEQYSEITPKTDGQPPVGDMTHDLGDVGKSSEEDADIDDAGEDEEEPGPSTARPMYAEPQPTSQGYSSVDPDDLARLAEAEQSGRVESGDTGQDGGSLTEDFLKTSHSLWVSLAAALQLPEGLAFGVEAEVAEPHMTSGSLVFLGIVVFTIITIYFVHLIMMKFSRESPMLEALSRTEHENRLKAEENATLHEELCKARAELEIVSSSFMASSGDITELDSQLDIIKSEYGIERSQLEERIVQLEHELEETTSNGLEMHKMLSEMLSAQKDTSTFQASVDHLQAMLDGQREKVETLTSDLALKTRLNEELHSELSASMERTKKLDYQVQQLTQSLQELTGSQEEANHRLQKETVLVKELKEANEALSQQTCDYDSKMSSLNSELKALQDTIHQLRESVEIKESELQVAKECLKQLRLTSDDDHAAPDEEKLSALFNVIRVKAELQRVNNERNDLAEQLTDAEMAQTNLEDAMSSIRSEVTELRTHHDLAIQEKREALSKLAVLSQYFEEKEAQLTKELESQEGLRLNAEGSAASVSKKIQNYGLELASYKTQVDSLRKELEDQENSYKVQIASQEQKAHENWLQARTAERKHEEQRQENSQLRNRLTLLQKEKEAQQLQVNIIKPTPKHANGSLSSPGLILDGVVDGDHSGLTSLHRDVDSPPVPPHPLHGPPPILPMMFPPGGPLPPGVPPPHGLPPGVHPPPGLPHGVPPPHGLPPHPFLAGEPPFMGPLPPLPGDRRLPPAGGMSSPPFRRSGSPTYDHRHDRYSPVSDRSHFSERRFSPPLRHRLPSPELHRNRSPDRRCDRTRSPDRRSDRMRSSPDHHTNRRTPDRRLDRRSPDRHFSTRSPDGYIRHRTSPQHYFDQPDYNNDDPRLRPPHIKGKKTSTPLGPNDR